MSNIYGRQVILPLTNKSGGGVVAGDVVVVDTTNNDAFTTNTAGAFTGGVGIAQETIANNATGRILVGGYAALVNVNASVTRGNFGKTHTVAKQATDAGASRGTGTFCQFLTGGTTPDAMMYPVDLLGSSLTNPMTNVGDIIYGGTAGVPTRLADVATGSVLLSGGVNTAPSWGYPTLTATTATLGGNVTMTSSGTWYDGPSMTLTGSCLVWGRVAVNVGTLSLAYDFVGARINSGGSVLAEAESITNQGGGTFTVDVSGYLTGLSSTTVKVQAMSANTNSATLLRDVQNGSSTTHTASYLMALRVG